MPATLRDVARLAGVSPSAVSRVLNEAADSRVSPATRQRILEAARSLSYICHSAARSLRSGHSANLGLVLPTYLDSPITPFYLLLMRGISQAATVRGLDLSLAFCSSFEQEVEKLRQLARSRRVDGVFVTGPREEDPRLTYLQHERVPFVVVGRPDREGVPSVDTENLEASARLIGHLIELGHERIGYIAEPLTWTFSADRLRGYRQALESQGIPFDQELVETADFTPASGRAAAERLLARRADLTAIAACDDMLAIGAIHAARESGRRVPQDIAVVGCDDFGFTEHVEPPLTTIRIDAERIGLVGAEMLATLVEGEGLACQRVVVEGKLVIRQSSGTGPAPSPARARGLLAPQGS